MKSDWLRTTRRASLGVAALFIAGCAAAPSPTDGGLIADPHEKTNRAFHDFNKDIDTLVLRPVAEGYDVFTPGLVKLLVSNELSYLSLPRIFLNRLLQGDLEEAGAALARFALNTTIGAVGLLDPATEMGLPHTPTDFGITLAMWGVEEGVYHVSPIFGPRTSRDLAGLVGQAVLDPAILLTFGVIDPPATVTTLEYGRVAVEPVNSRYQNADLLDHLLYETSDSYVSVRSGYIQSRRRAVSGETNLDELPDIFAD